MVWSAAVAVGTFALPADDDYGRADRWAFGHPGLPWLPYVAHLYFSWQGRWAGYGLESAILPNVDLTRRYPLLIAGLSLVDVLCVGTVCRWFTRRAPWSTTLSVTTVAIAFMWAGLPSVNESVYWFTGALENTTSLALAAALLAAVAAVAERRARAPRVLLAAAAAVVTGFHELYGGALCVALAVGWASTRGGQRDASRTWALTLAGATVGLAVVVLAPGNRARLGVDASHQPVSPLASLGLAGQLLWHHAHRWALDPKLLAASAWVAVSPSVVPIARSSCSRWLVPIAGAGCVAVGFAMPCLVFGNGIPARTLSGDRIMFVAAWLLTVHHWTHPLAPSPIPTGRIAASLALAVSLPISGNFRPALRDLRGPVVRWHIAAERRFARLRAAGRAHAPVSVRMLPPGPRPLLSGETSANTHDWRNFMMADYFGTGRLTLVPTVDWAIEGSNKQESPGCTSGAPSGRGGRNEDATDVPFTAP